MSALSLKKLKLINYRCFPTIEIDFHKQLTVLVAQNGFGKTAILDAIAIAFGPYVGAFDETVGKHFHPNDIRLSRVRETANCLPPSNNQTFRMPSPCCQMKSGAITKATVASNLMSTCKLGPAVSLKGSPTVSPTTAAAWTGFLTLLPSLSVMYLPP